MKTLPMEQQDAIINAKDHLKIVSELLAPGEFSEDNRGDLALLAQHLLDRINDQKLDDDEKAEAKACLRVVIDLISSGDGDVRRDDLSLLLAYLIRVLDEALNMDE
jgi:hypothetical protein